MLDIEQEEGFKKREKEFLTMTKILVLIAIMGIVASSILVYLNNSRKKERDKYRIESIKEIQSALDLYFKDHGQYSVSLEALATGGYIAIEPKDPLSGNPYAYAYHPEISPNFYHLGTSLEVPGNIILNSDKDFNSAKYKNGFNGYDKVKCLKNDPGLYCYDITN